MINLAFTDPITGLYNRQALNEIAKLPLEPEGLIYGALMLDLTGFKQINDEHTHAAGDAALGRVGDTLLAMCDAEGEFSAALPFRYGGDEFCILIPKDTFEKFVDRSHLSLLRWDDFTLQDRSLGFGASIGFAGPDEDVGLDELIGRADRAAKLSKHRDDEPVRWTSTLEHEAIISLRKRCGSCSTTITIQIAQTRVVIDGFRICPNCGKALP